MQTVKIIIKEIYNYGKKKQWYILSGNIILFSLIFLILWLSAALADSIFYFSTITRWGLLFINTSILFFLVFKFVIRPFRTWFNFNQNSDLSFVAREIGEKDQHIGDRLVNLYQLEKQKESSLQKAALNQLAKSFTDSNFNSKIERSNYFPGVRLYLPVLLSIVILFLFLPNQIYRSSLRLLNPANNYVIVPPFKFKVSPGNKSLLYGEPLEIAVTYNGPEIADMQLVLSAKDKPSVRVIDMEYRKNSYFTRFKEVTSSFSYQMIGLPQMAEDLSGKIVSDTFNVAVQIPPQIQELVLKTKAPEYTGGAQQKNDLNNGNLVALKGSKTNINLTTNKIISTASIVFNSIDSLKLQTKGKRAEGSFTISNAGTYTIDIKDTEGLVNQDPIRYSISIIPDNAPYINISEPGADVEARLDDILSLKIDAADDYGLNDIYLRYRYIKPGKSDSSWTRHNIKDFRSKKKKAELYKNLDFSNFYVGYNDQIEYYAVAVDNNSVDGNSKSKSAVYRVIFPSMDELFNEFNTAENEKMEDLERIADESQELKKKLEEINRELKRTEKMDWETKKQIENTLKKQQDAQKKIDQIQKDLEDMINKLDQNDLMNPEVMEKYNQLQELFQEIASPELMQAMKKLQEAIENANPKDVQKALENFKLNQEAFQQNLERTLELFKQVQLEQKLDQMIRQAEELSKKQNQLSEKIENKPSAPEEKNNLANQQKLQQELLESLKRNLDDILKQQKLNDFQEAKSELEKTKNEINEQNLSQQIDKISKQLNQQNFSEAGKESGELQKSFQQMQQNLSTAMQNLRQQHKQNVQKKMLAATQKMLKLSHEQENIEQKTRDVSQINEDIREMARQQANLQNNLGKLLSDLIQLSKETFFINPDMNKNMANAYSSMQKSLENMSERRNSQAASDQQRAMEALNNGINSMQQSMAQLSASESGTGFEQFLQQLQQMAGAQGGLNDETMNFFQQGQGNNGEMSLQQQAESQRMAAQQKAIQQSMSEMSDNAGNRSDILGRLNEMGEQMDEIVQDMLANNINKQTIQRQQQILSRMLDAQKSVREREFSKKRKAEQARQYVSKDPEQLKEYELSRQKKLQEALKKALSEGYYDDYERLIEAYFKKMSQNLKENATGK